MKIQNVIGREILDSRGNPTINVEIELYGGIKAYASVPSGASVGKKEALELRDKDISFYLGRGVHGAISNINEKISKLIIDKPVIEQGKIDDILIEADGTENKSNFGANAMLGVSLACARCASIYLNIPLYEYLGGIFGNILPCVMVNIINGGAHADNSLDFQEFMITPTGAINFSQGLRMVSETFHALKNILKKQNEITSLGDEGGFAPNLKTNKDALDLILEAIKKAGYSTDEIKICLDVASSELYKDGKYEIKSENLTLSSAEMVKYLKHLCEDYPIISIEDGMAEDDYEGWRILTDELGEKCLLVGDDLFVTNSKLLIEGMQEKIANAILIKPNQIGTLSETLNTIQLAKLGGYKTIISHRSGETTDTFISDLAVGVNSGLIKTGSISRGERICKYNRLLEIEKEINEKNPYTNPPFNYLGENSFYKYGYKNCSCNFGCNKRN